MTATLRAVLDSRVTHPETGRPVRVMILRMGWFRIERADGEHGVTLTARIPGFEPHVTQHTGQEAATAAAESIYAAYLAVVDAIKQADQETS